MDPPTDPLPATLEPAARARIAAEALPLRAPAGAVLFRPGDPCRGFVLLRAGRARVDLIAEDGHALLLYRVAPGEACAITTACLFAGEPYSAEGRAETSCEGLLLPAPLFARLVDQSAAFRSFVLGSDGTGAKELFHACVAPRLPDGTSMEKRLHMNGREVFKFAVRVMNTATLEAIEKAGLTPEDIKVFVPHQANLRIIDAARERLGLPWERVVVNVDRYGNTSTASIPLALKEAVDEGRIREGDHVLLVSFGAGLTWAAAVLTWGGA